jgi:potassium efflux system protein
LSLSCLTPQTLAQEPAPDSSPGSVAAEDPSVAINESTVTVELLESRLKEVESASGLDEASKTRLTELYRRAVSSLEAARSYDAKAAGYAESVKTAPATVAELRPKVAALQARAGQGAEQVPEDLSIPELEQRLAKEQADATAVAAKLAEIEKDLEGWAQRPVEARQGIARAKAALEDLAVEADRPVLEGEPAVVTQARKWVQETRQRELRAEILMRDQELLSHGPREDLLRAERDKAALDLEGIRERRRQLEERLNERRRVEAEQARSEAKAATLAAVGKHPLVQTLAEENARLTEELSRSTAALDRVDDEVAETQRRGKQIAEEFRSIRQRMEFAGLSQAMGQILLDRRQQLPDPVEFREAAKARERAIAETTLRQIGLDEERQRLRDVDGLVDELLADLPPAERDQGLQGEVREQLERRRELVEKTRNSESAYLRALGELDFAATELTTTVEGYDLFLAERLLWVRSSAPAGLDTLTDLPRALAWLLNPKGWVEVGRVLLHEARSSPLFWLWLLAVFLLLGKKVAIRRRLVGLAEELRRVRTDRFEYTVQALALTVLLALPLALLFAVIGWQLTGSVKTTPFAKAVGSAALAVSFGFFTFRFFSLLCIKGGVADRHFKWSGAVLARIRREFGWALLLFVPTAFVTAVVYSYRDIAYTASLGRVALLFLMAGLTVFAARLAHPTLGVFQNLVREHPEGWLTRLQNLWYPLMVATPLALAGLTLAGYTYTAATLLDSLVQALWLVFGLVILHQSVVRWLMVTRRRLALQATLERRAVRAAADQAADPQSLASLAVIEEEVDLASLDEQTRRLINAVIFVTALVGLWAIWSDVLPAFSKLEDITLWQYTGMVEGAENVIPFTLASAGLILVIVVLATIAARNLPALLEILLLRRMSVSAGGRYTVKTMTGYLITAGAALMVFGTLGLSWGQVQWLVAALGVGIGFGLQEIVANFISGLIILFERPVRVGDIVTIGDTTGVVTKIRIRATTIRNWDKQELLVPNKEFITGRLLNWTLSDPTNRVVITVGVDYGADVRLAMRLMEDAVREEERVLDDPAPLLSFEGFGDNALTLIARCYLGSMDYRIAVITALHHAINDKFREHGISIAFPQRDVHLTTPKPLDVRVRQD